MHKKAMKICTLEFLAACSVGLQPAGLVQRLATSHLRPSPATPATPAIFKFKQEQEAGAIFFQVLAPNTSAFSCN
jgi:hypothetical protein